MSAQQGSGQNVWKKEKTSTERRSSERKKRLAGEEYYTLRSKRKKDAKKAPIDEAECKCSYSCHKFTIASVRGKLHDLYRGSNMTYIDQMNYLLGLIEVLPVDRRRHGKYKDPKESRRQCSIAFLLPDKDGSFERVCKSTFMNTFGISGQTVATLVARKKKGDTTFIETRGGKRTTYTEEDRQQVRDHINSFPRDVSHYCRETSGDKEYLSIDLSVRKMFRVFTEKYPDSRVHLQYYQAVFNSDFPNLSFRQPRVDTCKTCDRLKILCTLRNEKGRQAKDELEQHHIEVENSFKAIKADSIDSTLPGSKSCTITIDLQKIFSLPKLTHSTMYYSRQLSCYNLGIHVFDTNDGVMCVWHEGVSGRGANEMASGLLHAINSAIQTSKCNLTVYSDNCAGQLKNQMFVCLYSMLIALGLFDRIDHKFLVSGHSFSASDRDFAIIEKNVKRSEMHTVSDVMSIIEKSRLIRPFKVLDLTEKPIFDFSSMAKSVFNTSQLQISQLCWIRVDKSDLSSVQTKKSYAEKELFKTCKILKRGVTVQDLVSKLTSTLEAKQGVPLIDEKKIEDLMNVLDYLEPKSQEFFEDIITEQISLRDD